MKRRIALFLTVVMILTMALPQIAAADSKEDNIYQFQTGVLPYSAQMEDETSVRVTWHRFTDCKAFVLSWKKAGSAEKAQSVRIDDSKADTYVVTGLEPKTDYVFNIKGVLTGADGKDLFTKDYEIEGSTYVHMPEYAISRVNCTSIMSFWHVKELYSKLNIYRSESKDGAYELIKTVESADDAPNADNLIQDTQFVCLSYNDYDVKEGQTYYYKAQAVGVVGEKSYSSEMSEAVALTANNEEGRFVTTLLNKRNAYTKQIKIKLTSHKANYTTYLKGVNYLVYDTGAGYGNGSGKRQKRIITKAEYSRDGKKYYTLKNKNVKVKAGQSVYLRITTKSRYWISKSLRQGEMSLKVKYDRPAFAGKVNNVELFIGRFDSHYKTYTGYGGIISANEDREHHPKDFAGACYGTYDDPSVAGAKASDTSVMLNWKSVSHAESYAIRYGTTKKSVIPPGGNPIIVPKYQVQFLIDGLKKGKTYYFSVVSCGNGEGTDEYDEAYGNIIKWDGKNFTRC